MVAGQDVLSRSLDVAALNAAQARLEQREVARSNHHAGTLRDVLDLHRIHRRAGLELNTVAQVGLSMGCSEHRAHELLDEAMTLQPLPGALEALDCGLMTVEQSRTLVKHLEPLPFEQRLRVWGLLQARLIAEAACASVLPPARLGELLRDWVISVDPAAAEQRRKAAEAQGGVDYRRRDDGLNDLFLLGLNGPDARGCLQNIRRYADDSVIPDDPRSPGRRLLDAAKDLLLGRTPFVFDEQAHCRPGCDCRPGQPAPCGADLTLLVPLGAALGTTDELAELTAHGPIEPDLLHDLLMAAPVLRAVFVDENGVPVADSPRVERPPRNDHAAVRAAILRLANSPPGPHQPRHPGDHPSDPDPPPARAPGPSALTLLAQIHDRARAAADAARPVLLAHGHPAGTPGAYRPSRRLARFLRAPRAPLRVARLRRPCHPLRPRPRPRAPARPDLPVRPRAAVPPAPPGQAERLDQAARPRRQRALDQPHRPHLDQPQPAHPAPAAGPADATAAGPEPARPAQPDRARARAPGPRSRQPPLGRPRRLELRTQDLEPHQVDPDPPRDTRWSTDLDDHYAWLDLREPIDAWPSGSWSRMPA